MRIIPLAPVRGAILGFWLTVLLVLSFCYCHEKTVEVIGGVECADCAVNNIKTNHALSGLQISIDCKVADGDLKTVGVSQLDEKWQFKVILPSGMVKDDGQLKEDCFAQLHSASSVPCSSNNDLEASKLIFKSNSNGKLTFSPAGKLVLSPITCTSAFFWPRYKMHPWHKRPISAYFPPFPSHPPLVFPPVHEEPLPTPEPIYKPPPIDSSPEEPYPPPPPPPPYSRPLPPPAPVYRSPPMYTRPLPPPVPEYTRPLPPPAPVYRSPPIIRPPNYMKPLPPPVPEYTRPLPPPVPISRSPPVHRRHFAPPTVHRKPLPPPTVHRRPLPPPTRGSKPPLIPGYRKPCPPVPGNTKPMPPPLPIYSPPPIPESPVHTRPLPPPFPFYEPVQPISRQPIPPFPKKPCPPLPIIPRLPSVPKFPPIPRIPLKYFYHPKFGYWPLPPYSSQP